MKLSKPNNKLRKIRLQTPQEQTIPTRPTTQMSPWLEEIQLNISTSPLQVVVPSPKIWWKNCILNWSIRSFLILETVVSKSTILWLMWILWVRLWHLCCHVLKITDTRSMSWSINLSLQVSSTSWVRLKSTVLEIHTSPSNLSPKHPPIWSVPSSTQWVECSMLA